ncbi:MAG: hypothetical protein QOH39_2396 [Verrucomicrobiota bacterium]|jgi:hypothetical protein
MAFASKKRNVRPPVEGPLRRLPGQSVREKRERLFDDKIVAYLLALLVAWMFALWQWIYKWTGSKPSPGVATLVAIVVTVYCVYRIWRFRTEFRNLNLAEKGERRVSEALTQLRRKRYVAFDDLVVTGENIDHVLVGPGGIFAIETKAYSIFGNGCVGVDEAGVLRLGNKAAFGDPIGQAMRCAQHVTKLLEDRTRKSHDVTPLLIFPGWTLKRAKADTGVVVLNDRSISEFFEALPRVFSDEQITWVCSHLDQIART